jgi:recombination protein RecT
MSTQNTQIAPFKQKVATVRGMFSERQKQMQAVLPSFLTPERLVTLALAAAQNTPKLLECTPISFVQAVMQAGRLGLEPDGLLGHSYLVPFKGKVVLVPGYKGLLRLARNSGQISTIQAHEVCANDKFTFHYGLDPKLEHTPTAEDPGEVVAFYAVARLKDGSTQFEVMWRRQVDAIRDESQGYQAAKRYNSPTPWDGYYAEMGKKTVLRRLLKMLPASVEAQQAISLDEQAEAGIEQHFDIIDLPEEDGGNGGGNGSKLDEIVNASKTAAPEPTKAAAEPQEDPAEAQRRVQAERAAEKKGKKGTDSSYSETEPDPFKSGELSFKG